MAARRKQPPLKEDKLVCLTLARSVQPFFDSMKVAAGLATLDEILPRLERIEPEKALERIRLAKKWAKKQLAAPPLKI